VPVARALHLCTDESVIGSVFYVMEFVDGPIHWDPSLPDVAADHRSAHFDAMVDALIALAKIDVDAAGLGDFGKSGNYFARQVARWTEQYRAAQTQRIEAMEDLIVWLPEHVPSDDARSLVHGDFRIDNLIWHRDAPRIAAIVDWELATLGSAFADIAYLCMALRLPRNGVLPGLAGIDRDALGIPSERALVDRFAAGSGHDPRPHWNFLLAFQFFRLASIAQGVLKRALQGNASSERAQQAGAMTATIAQLGAEQTR
jgi:aminoglycoside phosphotransferase (APT) family kinase protein